MTLDVLETTLSWKFKKSQKQHYFGKSKNTRTITFSDTKNDSPSNKSGWKDYIEKV